MSRTKGVHVPCPVHAWGVGGVGGGGGYVVLDPCRAEGVVGGVCCTISIGRVRKNSGEKRQAHYQPQLSTGKRRGDRPVVLGGCTHLLVTSGISLVRYLSGQTQRSQQWH